jgi:RNA recognition motif-containing protein
MDLLGVHAASAENVRLLRDPNKNPRGAAVVRMSSEEAATGVISSLNGVPMRGITGGHVLQVRPWRPEFRPDRISDNEIAQTFHGVGRTSNYKQRSSQVLSSSKFNSAIGNKDQKPPSIYAKEETISGNRSYGLPPSSSAADYENGGSDDEQQLFVLFVYHLPSSVSEEYLMDLFSQFGGEIESIRVMQGKGYGFISYYNEKDAIYAMAKLNGQAVAGSGRGIQIELKTEYV